MCRKGYFLLLYFFVGKFRYAFIWDSFGRVRFRFILVFFEVGVCRAVRRIRWFWRSVLVRRVLRFRVECFRVWFLICTRVVRVFLYVFVLLRGLMILIGLGTGYIFIK